jgi:hypothetical protein
LAEEDNKRDIVALIAGEKMQKFNFQLFTGNFIFHQRQTFRPGYQPKPDKGKSCGMFKILPAAWL